MPKFIDLTGQKFGRLIVVQRVNNCKNQSRYLCKCDCGNETICYATNLRKGTTTSCGCFKQEKAQQNQVTDLTGQRFGRLTVMSRADNKIDSNGRSKVMWKCVCDCGTQNVIVSSNCLKRGETKSCGCLRKDFLREKLSKDITGQRFGRLVAVYKNEEATINNKHGHTIWHCKCDCGNECDIDISHLTKGETQSCGCLQKERASIAKTKDIRKYDEDGNVIEKLCPCCNKWLPISSYSQYKNSKDGYASFCRECSHQKLEIRYSYYKTNAKSKNREFNITLQQFDDVTKKPCIYCGEFNQNFQDIPFSGMDRIDSTKGYTIDNVVPCCTVCNLMKKDANVYDWINHLKMIIRHFNPKDLQNFKEQ